MQKSSFCLSKLALLNNENRYQWLYYQLLCQRLYHTHTSISISIWRALQHIKPFTAIGNQRMRRIQIARKSRCKRQKTFTLRGAKRWQDMTKPHVIPKGKKDDVAI